MIYLDASVLVPIFIEDDWTSGVLAWLETRPALSVSDWTMAEFSSALSFHVRKRRLTIEERDKAENALNSWAYGQVEIVALDEEDGFMARRTLHRHPKLRTPDALHLTIVRRLGHEFATYDQDLAEAARREGVVVVQP